MVSLQHAAPIPSERETVLETHGEARRLQLALPDSQNHREDLDQPSALQPPANAISATCLDQSYLLRQAAHIGQFEISDHLHGEEEKYTDLPAPNKISVRTPHMFGSYILLFPGQ